MFKFNNTHIFTGYLKQLLSSFNLPTCKIYTKEFAEYLDKYGTEDPRIVESFDNIEYFYTAGVSLSKERMATRVNYLKNNEVYNYFWTYDQHKPKLGKSNSSWKRVSNVFYSGAVGINGLTKNLNSPGSLYDTTTHEYLGDYLRFMRDYHNINLMSLYNCFNNKICNNIYYKHKLKVVNPDFNKYKEADNTNPAYKDVERIFDAQDPEYRIYALPVKLFSNYTIALDCSQGVEMFCGFYRTALDMTNKSKDLISKTYQKINKTFFKQPFLYDKLNVEHWSFEHDIAVQKDAPIPPLVNNDRITRWDIINRENDLKLFIKVPASCKSSITILEGDYRGFNDIKYTPAGNDKWEFRQNHATINFESLPVNDEGIFTPVGKLQLLALNTGESYPFADRLIEYLCGSAITPIDEITDNVKRAQKVMSQNQHYFKIDGLWENKIQKIIYDYMINSGPIDVKNGKLINKHSGINPHNYGYHHVLGHTAKSTLYDVLGYVDKDAEKWYASWTIENGKARVKDSIQNVDIYTDNNGKSLWDI